MPGQSTRAARNVIARWSGGDEKRALISRTLLEELFRKLSKRRELVVAGSVPRLSRVHTRPHSDPRVSLTYLATDTAAVRTSQVPKTLCGDEFRGESLPAPADRDIFADVSFSLKLARLTRTGARYIGAESYYTGDVKSSSH